MNATFKITEKNIELELENFNCQSFRVVGTKPSADCMSEIKYPVGKPIFLITSNMPEDLQKEIEKMISNYCNH